MTAKRQTTVLAVALYGGKEPHIADPSSSNRWEPGPAQPLFKRALDLRRSRLGADHPDTLESAGNFAVILRELGHYEQAYQLGEDTLARRRRVLRMACPFAPVPRPLRWIESYTWVWIIGCALLLMTAALVDRRR